MSGQPLNLGPGVLWLGPTGAPPPGVDLERLRRDRAEHAARQRRFAALFRAPGGR